MLRTSSGRMYCRECGDVAGRMRDLCDGCHVAEVQMHLEDRQRLGRPGKDVLQEAYSDALETRPLSSFIRTTRAYERPRMLPPLEDAPFHEETEPLPMSMPPPPQKASAEQPMPLPPPLQPASLLESAPLYAGLLLPRAIRMIRFYLRLDIVATGAKVGCSKSFIGHLESGYAPVSARWLARYAEGLGFAEASILAFAKALTEGPAADDDALDMACKFVHICAEGPAWSIDQPSVTD